MPGSEPKHVTHGLPEERKALALRYTMDAAEAERREKLAPEVRAAEPRSANGSSAARSEVAPKPVAAAPGTAPQRPYLVSSLKQRLGITRSHRDVREAEAPVRLRASDAPDRSLRCARCGQECSYKAKDWTFRLFGDDQLHAVCRDCDERDFSGARQGGSLSVRPLPE